MTPRHAPRLDPPLAFALVRPILAAPHPRPDRLGLLFGPARRGRRSGPAPSRARVSFLSSFFDYLDLVLVAERRPADVLRAGPGCPFGSLDLSMTAFATIDELAKGRIPIKWQKVPRRDTRDISIYVERGANAYFAMR